MTGRSLIQAAGFAAFAVAIDQTTKAITLAVLQPSRVIPVTPFLNLTLWFNEGASFGMLGGMMQGRPFAMIALTGFVSALIGVWALRASTGSERAGLSLIFGGSLGNIIDRFRQGAVTDFLDLYWQDWHWPTFNMGDVAIFIGAMLILFNAMPLRRKTEATRA